MPILVTEKLLNHVSGMISGVAAVYNRQSYWEEMKVAIAQHDEFLRSRVGWIESEVMEWLRLRIDAREETHTSSE